MQKQPLPTCYPNVVLHQRWDFCLKYRVLLVPIGAQHDIHHLGTMLNLKNRLIEQKFGLDNIELVRFCELQAGKYELSNLPVAAAGESMQKRHTKRHTKK